MAEISEAELQALMDIVKHPRVIGTEWLGDLDLPKYNDDEQLEALIKLKEIGDKRSLSFFEEQFMRCAIIHCNPNVPSPLTKIQGDAIIAIAGFAYFDQIVIEKILPKIIETMEDDMDFYTMEYVEKNKSNKLKVICNNFGNSENHRKWSTVLEKLVESSNLGENE